MNDPHPLLARLDPVLDLSPSEREAVLAVPVRREAVAADRVVSREGDRPSRSFLVEEGLTCLSKLTSPGRRQIMAFHVPGDMPDLHTLHLATLDSDIWAVSGSVLVFMEHAPLRALCAAQPRIAAELWRVTLVDAAIFREWTVNVGPRQAVARLAHLFCEVLTRMEAAGRAWAGGCPFPVTQSDLAEALGLSDVHLNRTLQELRSLQLIEFDQGRLKVLDRAALAELGDFRPNYLHLRDRHDAGPVRSF